MQRKLSLMAQQQKLDQRSPYKEMLDYSRMSALTEIMMSDYMNAVAVPPEELQKYYNDHKEPHKQVKVSAIYVAFGEGQSANASSGSASSQMSRATKRALTEDEAKAKAAKLAAQARAGEDFKKLVKENSDDETSRDKGGDFGTWRVADNVPDMLRNAVFSLKEGEVADPVQQARGYYIFRADEVSYAPFEQVRDSIFTQVKQQRTQEWMKTIDASTTVEFPGKKEPR
jgi:parvulin-like peptidyl-prolyl isomerase